MSDCNCTYKSNTAHMCEGCRRRIEREADALQLRKSAAKKRNPVPLAERLKASEEEIQRLDRELDRLLSE